MKPIEIVTGVTVTFTRDIPKVIEEPLITTVIKAAELYQYSRVNLKVKSVCPDCHSILIEETDVDTKTLYQWYCSNKGCNYKF